MDQPEVATSCEGKRRKKNFCLNKNITLQEATIIVPAAGTIASIGDVAAHADAETTGNTNRIIYVTTRVTRVTWILLLLFILNFYTATSKHKVPASRSSAESSQQLSQQVNNGSEVECGVFRVEVQVHKA